MDSDLSKNISPQPDLGDLLPEESKKRKSSWIIISVITVLLLLLATGVITSNQWCWGCNIYGSRESITKSAIAKNDPSLCNKVGWTDTSDGWPSRKVGSCYMDVAIATKNIEVCKMYRAMPKYSGDVLFNDAECYLRASRSPETDYVQCQNIKYGNKRSECYSNFANVLKNPTLCENVVTGQIEMGKCVIGLLNVETFDKYTDFYKKYCPIFSQENYHWKDQCTSFIK